MFVEKKEGQTYHNNPRFFQRGKVLLHYNRSGIQKMIGLFSHWKKKNEEYILSTDNTGGYSLGQGTSIAVPHVAGAAALYKSLDPSANPSQVDAFLKSVGTQSPPTGNPLVPCNGAGRGYFDDRYPSASGVLTDNIKEPLLHMGGIK
jgi:hypothetical protein